MRKRFCSHYTFCAPDSIFRQAVVEQDESQLVTDILLSHSGIMAETAGTLFYDGIISRQPVSLKKRLTNREIAQLNRDFHYFDLSGDEPFHLIRETGTKPLLLDFGSDRVATQTGSWTDFFIEFPDLTVFDVIAACAYYKRSLSCGRE